MPEEAEPKNDASIKETKMKQSKKKAKGPDRNSKKIVIIIMAILILCFCCLFCLVMGVLIYKTSEIRPNSSLVNQTDPGNGTNSSGDAPNQTPGADQPTQPIKQLDFSVTIGNGKLFKVNKDKSTEVLNILPDKQKGYQTFYPEKGILLFTTYEKDPANDAFISAALYEYDFTTEKLRVVADKHANFGQVKLEEMSSLAFDINNFGLSPNGKYIYHNQCYLQVLDRQTLKQVFSGKSDFNSEDCTLESSECFSGIQWSPNNNLMTTIKGAGGGWYETSLYEIGDGSFKQINSKIPTELNLAYNSDDSGTSRFNYIGGFTPNGILIYSEITDYSTTSKSEIHYLDLKTGEKTRVHLNTLDFSEGDQFSKPIGQNRYVKTEEGKFSIGEINMQALEPFVVSEINPEASGDIKDARLISFDFSKQSNPDKVLVLEEITSFEEKQALGTPHREWLFDVNSKKYYKLHDYINKDICNQYSVRSYEYLEETDAVAVWCSSYPGAKENYNKYAQVIFLDNMKSVIVK